MMVGEAGELEIERLKQVIVVNESLKLPRGKLSAQVAHAAVLAFINAAPRAQNAWLESGMPKVVVDGASESELVDLAQRVSEGGLPFALIRDAGRTVVPTGTVTCLGIGPAREDDINQFTGKMKLVR
jgi:peptidyl-tRNA hydrolase, PTH2 family